MKLEWLFFPLLALVFATCTVMVEREQTKRSKICKEFLLTCDERGKKCEC